MKPIILVVCVLSTCALAAPGIPYGGMDDTQGPMASNKPSPMPPAVSGGASPSESARLAMPSGVPPPAPASVGPAMESSMSEPSASGSGSPSEEISSPTPSSEDASTSAASEDASSSSVSGSASRLSMVPSTEAPETVSPPASDVPEEQRSKSDAETSQEAISDPAAPESQSSSLTDVQAESGDSGTSAYSGRKRRSVSRRRY